MHIFRQYYCILNRLQYNVNTTFIHTGKQSRATCSIAIFTRLQRLESNLRGLRGVLADHADLHLRDSLHMHPTSRICIYRTNATWTYTACTYTYVPALHGPAPPHLDLQAPHQIHLHLRNLPMRTTPGSPHPRTHTSLSAGGDVESPHN